MSRQVSHKARKPKDYNNHTQKNNQTESKTKGDTILKKKTLKGSILIHLFGDNTKATIGHSVFHKGPSCIPRRISSPNYHKPNKIYAILNSIPIHKFVYPDSKKNQNTNSRFSLAKEAVTRPLEAILEPIGEKRAGRRRAREGEVGHQRDNPVFAGNVVDANAMALRTATTEGLESFDLGFEIEEEGSE